MNPSRMLRSRSSGLLPVTQGTHNFSREGSRLGLHTLRRKAGLQPDMLQRLLTYVFVAILLAGSVYGVMHVGRSGVATQPDDFGLAEGGAYFDASAAIGIGSSSGSGGGTLRQHKRQQQRHVQGGGKALGGALDRRAAMEARQQQHGGKGEEAQQAGEVVRSEGSHLEKDLLEWDSIDAAETAEDVALRDQLASEAQHLAELQLMEAAHQQAAAAAAAAGEMEGQGQRQGDQQADLSHLHADPAVAAAVAAHIERQQAMPRRTGASLYAANLSAVDIQGQALHTAHLAGHVTLIVNVATHCGFTEANYEGLTRLHERYKEFGFEVLAFPCNQFGHQEPGSHAEIAEFAARFGSKFTMMGKVDVNGPQQHPVFAWLKANTPPQQGHKEGEEIEWNFAKFLIDKHGHAVKRYGSDFLYHDLELDVYNELIKFV
ncbi:hypothetical protein D9Q98_007434 [Chlorella vulgaris]|uniref:Glutathione peroxidase n=1 Tax=Chlorella vulgaris TaxID=3077 RepID=A0A9D4TL64_CHLVU|nr:hypothetical protein D9Q98_007434 [Chlorella vulgaris]